jgi:pyruvate ferredoxin oxidoreductase alpha subunit
VESRAAAVVDQNISVGMGGIIFSEVAAAVYSLRDRPRLLSFIGGLGGKNISPREFEFIFDQMVEAGEGEGEEEQMAEGREADAQLLFTEKEVEEITNLKKIAGKEAKP